MEIIRFDMPTLSCRVALAGDFHKGAANCHHDLVDELIQDMKNGLFLINTGDNLEAITPNDKRYAHASVDIQRGLMTPQAQANHLVDIFKPVRKQIISWGEGNHEAKLWNIASFGQEIAADLGCAYGGYNYIVQFYYKNRRMFNFFISHGHGRLPKGAKDPIQRKANRKAHLKRKLEATGFADCIVMAMGHTHQLLIVEPTIDEATNLATTQTKIKREKRHITNQRAKYIPPERRWYVNTGSFLKLYMPPGSKAFSYAEIMMLDPADLGWAVVDVQKGRVEKVEERLS